MNELPVSGQKADQNLEEEFKPKVKYCKLLFLIPDPPTRSNIPLKLLSF